MFPIMGKEVVYEAYGQYDRVAIQGTNTQNSFCVFLILMKQKCQRKIYTYLGKAMALYTHGFTLHCNI